MTLNELRKEWEEDCVVVAQTQPDEGTFLVIVRLIDGKYACYRYFTIGGNWEASGDACHVDAETAMKWAWNPKALPNKEFRDED